MDERLRTMALSDGRYAPEAYRFLLEGLEQAIQMTGRGDLEGKERHVTGQDVLDGLIAHGRRCFGPLTAQVWRSWGVHEPLDWGRCVFVMIDASLLSRQESDTIEDFRSRLDFDREFVEGYRIEPPAEL